jgi:ATP-dependent Lon protease
LPKRKANTTEDVKIPSNPLDRVIGQDDAVKIARVAAKQRRNLLLVGPPGIGKSMIAQAMSFLIEVPEHEVRVIHNLMYPERPYVEVKSRAQVEQESDEINAADGMIVSPEDIPADVSEKLGYRCPSCGYISMYTDTTCPRCGEQKNKNNAQGPFGDMFNVLGAALGVQNNMERVSSTRRVGEKEEVIIYERFNDKVKILDEKALERKKKMEKKSPSKVIVPLNRNTFILATGASETELLGDVRHDPYGGHPQLGTMPYERVIAGSIHEAHEGVLFIDEITHLGELQRSILTAMQEKKFPITGRNPQSAGASVRVDSVPTDFILVGACNIQDLPQILSPLRSRIAGNGYEVLMEVSMPYNEKNVERYLQFIAQEIISDGKIPHMEIDAAMIIVEEGKRRASIIDHRENALTLRLRELGGLIRAAGDIAVSKEHKYITKDDVMEALKIYMPVEEKINKIYGNMGNAISSESTASQKMSGYYGGFHNYYVDPSYQ